MRAPVAYMGMLSRKQLFLKQRGWLTLVAGLVAAAALFPAPARPSRSATVIARRGYWARYPEGSWLGFQQARDAGARLSADAVLTGDNVWALLHDTTLERLYCRPWSVDAVTYDQIKDLAYCGPLADRYPQRGIPRVRDFLQEFGPAVAEVELKNTPALSPERRAAALDEVANLIAPLRGTLMVTSFHPADLRELKQRDENLRTGLVVYYAREISRVRAGDWESIDAVSVRAQSVSARLLSRLRARGKTIWVYDSGKPRSRRRVRQLARLAPDGYVVSDPVAFRKDLAFVQRPPVRWWGR